MSKIKKLREELLGKIREKIEFIGFYEFEDTDNVQFMFEVGAPGMDCPDERHFISSFDYNNGEYLINHDVFDADTPTTTALADLESDFTVEELERLLNAIEKINIVRATYVSEWDNGTTVRSPCKFDVDGLRCFDIQQGDTDVGNAQLLEEYVETEDNSFHETDGVTFDY